MKSRGNEWGHVIPKADSKFWTGDHSIRKSYIKGIQCSFRFWTYNILPPILSSLHISFMCSQSISTLIKKVSTFNNAHSILLDSYVLLDLYSRWFPIWLLTRLIVHEMYNVKIILLETPFTYEFDCMLCVSCMSYIITLTFSQSSIVEVDPLT